MEDLLAALNKSDSVTVIPTAPNDFFDYDGLFKGLYQNLTCNVKQNHIFSCLSQDKMNLWERNNDEHRVCTHTCFKKGCNMNAADLRVYSSKPALVAVESIGINPYKMVELDFKYCPHIPIEYQENILYCWPDAQEMLIVRRRGVSDQCFGQSFRKQS